MEVTQMSVPYTVWIGECQTWGCGVAFRFDNMIPYRVERLIFLNALVRPLHRGVIAIGDPADIETVKRLVEKAEKIESFIGHEATAKLLSQKLGINIPVNRGMYVPKHNDYVVIVALKRRLEKPEDVKDIRDEDIEFRIALYWLE
jgi:hypothetical protein